MTWLFIRFYLGVLAVLFLAWYIHGTVLQYRSDADLARVIWEAHAGGARLVATKIDGAPEEGREDVFFSIRKEFAYPLTMAAAEEAPAAVKEQFSSGQDVAYHRDGDRHYVVSQLECQPMYVWLGPFPSYRLQEIENAIGGWMRLAASQLESKSQSEWDTSITQLQKQFEVPIEHVDVASLPEHVRGRFARGDKIVFFAQQPSGNDRYLSATPISGHQQALQFGPFPSFQHIEQNAAATTLALVLLPAALAIAFLIRPVVRQLHHVEDAAKAIASGDLDARVDENRVHAAKPLAGAFNLMADRTQSLVRSQRELLQAVSHELRTPLARIRFAADLIGTAKSDQERQERLKAVDDAAQQLDDLVDELLTYVRAESDAANVETQPVLVYELFSEVIETIGPLFPAVQFQIEGQDDDLTVIAHRAGLQRAISNLTRNAARFCRKQVVLSAVKARPGISIRIDDDGLGIAEADRARIFEPFVRLDECAEAGSGLGLALVQRIVASHGGDVVVTTSPAGGARFEVLLADMASAEQKHVSASHHQPLPTWKNDNLEETAT